MRTDLVRLRNIVQRKQLNDSGFNVDMICCLWAKSGIDRNT